MLESNKHCLSIWSWRSCTSIWFMQPRFNRRGVICFFPSPSPTHVSLSNHKPHSLAFTVSVHQVNIVALGPANGQAYFWGLKCRSVPMMSQWCPCHLKFESQPLADAFRPGSEPNLQSKLGIHTNEEGQNPDDFDGEAVVPGLTLISYIWYDMIWLHIHIYVYIVYMYTKSTDIRGERPTSWDSASMRSLSLHIDCCVP